MNRNKGTLKHIDLPLVLSYIALVIIGWISIYASSYTESQTSIFSLDYKSGLQILWFGISLVIAFLIIFVLPSKLYFTLSWWLYLSIIILLILVLVIGIEVNGSKSWLGIGNLRFQPSELSKISTFLCLSVVMGKYNFKVNRLGDIGIALATIALPALLIILEPEIGTILVYAGLIFVFYREGMSGWILLFIFYCILAFIITLKFSPFVAIIVTTAIASLILTNYSNQKVKSFIKSIIIITILSFIPTILKTNYLSEKITLKPEYILLIILGLILIPLIKLFPKKRRKIIRGVIISSVLSIILIFSVETIFNNVLKPHHQARIENLLGITQDLQGAGYNVNQSKIAIGSGGFAGKGFLNGTQTKFDFVPEQSTDFIFCTIGEEWGFLGSFVVITLFFIMIGRIIILSENQKDSRGRIYGYCLASCLFMHVLINIGMTIGIMPVVGIPLPFISYGGSSLVTFTTLLFIFIKLDIERWNY